jgi:hypothetical protein
MVYGSDAVLPEFFVNVSGSVLPNVSTEPEAIFWGISDPQGWKNEGAASQRKIIVRCNRSQDKLSIRKAVCSLSGIGLDVVPKVPAKEYLVVASMSDLLKASGKGQIEIDLDSPSGQKLLVPITVKVQGR